MREQACKYGAKIETRLSSPSWSETNRRLFTATWGSGSVEATDRSSSQPASPTAVRRWTKSFTTRRLARGLIRYCPICDGYEVTDKKVGVIGSDSHGVAEAIFLRSFTADVTLIAPDKALRLKPEDQQKLKAAGSTASTARRKRSRSTDNCIVVDTAEGHYTFDSIYPALGSDTHTQLAEMVGARSRATICIRVDSHQRTSVAGPLCGRRRGDRPRPDQPCDGRRRRRRDDHPQRSLREGPALAREHRGNGTGGRRHLGEEFRVEDDAPVLEVRRCRRGTGSAIGARPASSISRRSPAPKFSTATTVPTALPSRSTHGRPIRSA